MSISKEWSQIIQKVADRHYDLNSVKYLITGGDGDTWVKRSFDYIWVEKRANVLDRFHLYRASKTALGFNRDSMHIVRHMRHEGFGAVVEDLKGAIKNAKGKRKQRIIKYVRYMEGNQNSLKDVQISENSRTFSLGGIESNGDKLVVRRMKGKGRS